MFDTAVSLAAAQGWSNEAPLRGLRRALLQAAQPGANSSSSPETAHHPARVAAKDLAPQEAAPVDSTVGARGDEEDAEAALELIERLSMAPPPPPPPLPSPAPANAPAEPLLSLLTNLHMYSRQPSQHRGGDAANGSAGGLGGWPAEGAFPNLRVRFLPSRLPAKDVMVRVEGR